MGLPPSKSPTGLSACTSAEPISEAGLEQNTGLPDIHGPDPVRSPEPTNRVSLETAYTMFTWQTWGTPQVTWRT